MKIEEINNKFVVTDFDEIDAYKIARKIEADGIWFYARLLNRVFNPKAKEILKFLEGEERKHLAFFEKQLLKKIEAREDSSEDDDLLGSMDFGIFWPYQEINELEKVIDQNTDKALCLGQVIEEKSIQFYQLCQGKITSDKVKEELTQIIEEEKKHKQLLENILKRREDV